MYMARPRKPLWWFWDDGQKQNVYFYYYGNQIQRGVAQQTA